jgi:mRNA interferase RelE/StbE
MERIAVQWTETAKEGLRQLPQKVRRGLLDKAGALRDADDPESIHKPLTGPLQGYYRLCYSRYRAIYRIEREKLANDDVIQRVVVLFVAAGIRNEGDKNDIYRLAEKLLKMGILGVDGKIGEINLDSQ